jgi:hypothetical protein
MVESSNFPDHWGSPPEVMTCDSVPLLGGYGHGSSDLGQWIAEKMKIDRLAGKMSFPKSWGDEPVMQTRDLRPLPLGYGQGSGTLARWIKEKATAEGTYHEDEK